MIAGESRVVAMLTVGSAGVFGRGWPDQARGTNRPVVRQSHAEPRLNTVPATMFAV